MKLEKIINLQMNLIDQLSENLEEEKCINQVKTALGVLI